jgi:hypothetical protein
MQTRSLESLATAESAVERQSQAEHSPSLPKTKRETTSSAAALHLPAALLEPSEESQPPMAAAAQPQKLA